MLLKLPSADLHESLLSYFYPLNCRTGQISCQWLLDPGFLVGCKHLVQGSDLSYQSLIVNQMSTVGGICGKDTFVSLVSRFLKNINTILTITKIFAASRFHKHDQNLKICTCLKYFANNKYVRVNNILFISVF